MPACKTDVKPNMMIMMMMMTMMMMRLYVRPDILVINLVKCDSQKQRKVDFRKHKNRKSAVSRWISPSFDTLNQEQKINIFKKFREGQKV